MSNERGELIVISAPSGAGKTTLIHELFASRGEAVRNLEYSVSHTTRAPRAGEVDGRDYHFVDQAEFDRLIEQEGFLEWAVVHGRHYGTSCSEVESRLCRGIDVLLDIDVQGAEQVRRRFPQAISIFILPPSFAELRRRLEGRAQDPPPQIARRLETSIDEMRCWESYDYVILNQDPDRAAEALAAVILARRLRRQRMQPQILRVLESFQAASS